MKARRRSASKGALWAGLAVLALGVAGCAQDAPLSWVDPAGPIARDIKGLWDLVFYAAVAVFVLVEGLLVITLIRFRQRKGDDSEPKQTHGNTRLEIAWTIAPAVLLAALGIPTVLTIFALAREPADAVRIEVRAHQWWWEYRYAGEDVVAANELHIPAGRPVLLELNSDDVIHSYWVPRLGGKQDVVPGRTNHVSIQADDPGVYLGTCAEYCGLSHANMRVKVFAHAPSDYERWLADQRRPLTGRRTGAAAEGKRIFEQQACATCHTVRGTPAEARVGPDLTHFASRTTFAGAMFQNTEDNLRDWLRDAPDMKPGSKMPAGVADLGLTEDDISALIAYLETLR